jgi:hypothetical protein
MGQGVQVHKARVCLNKALDTKGKCGSKMPHLELMEKVC